MCFAHRPLTYRLSSLVTDLRFYLLLISILFCLHSALFSTYIIDDAMISCTYARNLVEGHGLVLNPGGERVEGYSNFLWVLILSLAFKADPGFLGPVWILKLLGLIFGLATLAILFWLPTVAFGLRPNDPLRLFDPFILACSSPFVFWSVAGLENPLYSFLILLSCYLYLKEMRNRETWPWSAISLLLVALTRPEGLIYFVALGVHRLLLLVIDKRMPSKGDIVWAGTFLFPYIVFLLWRYGYFGYWVPNTFYAKAGNRKLLKLWKYLADFDDPGWRYVFSYLRWQSIPLVLVFISILDRKNWRTLAVFFGLLGSAILYIIYVGGDFWQEFRFFSPIVPIIIILIGHGLTWFRHLLSKNRIAFLLALAVATVAILIPNLSDSANPVFSVDMKGVAQRGKRFNSISQRAHLENAKYLEPDIGSTAFYSGLEIIDLAKLADVHLARFNWYPLFLKQYILEEQRPELVHTHGAWTRASKLTRYPEFWEAYLPIQIWEDEWGISGDFIRKDIFIVDDETQLGHQLDVLFDELRLVDFKLDTPVPFPGQRLSFTWYWQCRAKCKGDYSFLLELVGKNGQELVRLYNPVFGWYPTSQWEEGEIVKETRELEIPVDWNGVYQVFIGAIHNRSGIHQLIGEITISSEEAKRLARANFAEFLDLTNDAQYKDALKKIELAANLDPLNEEYSMELNEAQDRLQGYLIELSAQQLGIGDQETAALFFLEAVSIKPLPQGVRTMQRRLSRIFFDQGQDSFDQHDYDIAFYHFQRALEIDPSNAQARHRLEDSRVKMHYVDYYCDTHQLDRLYKIYEDEQGFGNPLETVDRIKLYLCLQSVADEDVLRAMQLEIGMPDPSSNLNLILKDENGIVRFRILGYRIHKLSGDQKPRLTLYFEVLKAVKQDFRIWVHGTVKDRTLLPEDRQAAGFAVFDHEPLVATSRWPEGRVLAESYTLEANPGAYNLSLGLWDPKDGKQLCVERDNTCEVYLGWLLLGYDLDTINAYNAEELVKIYQYVNIPEIPMKDRATVLARIRGALADLDWEQLPLATLVDLQEKKDDSLAKTIRLYLLSRLSLNIDVTLSDRYDVPKLQVLGYSTNQSLLEDGLEINIYFQVLDAIEQDYDIWLRAYPEDKSILPKDRQEHGFLDVHYGLPTSEWQVGRIYRSTHSIKAPSGVYSVLFGVWSPRDDSTLCPRHSEICYIGLGQHLIGYDLDNLASYNAEQLVDIYNYARNSDLNTPTEDPETFLDRVKLQLEQADWPSLPLETILNLQLNADDTLMKILKPNLLNRIPTNVDMVLVDEDGNQKLHVLGYTVDSPAQASSGLTLTLYSKVLVDQEIDYRIWLHALVQDRAVLPEARQEAGFLNVNHVPEVSISQRTPGRFYQDSIFIAANPGEYHLVLGFWHPEDGRRLYSEHNDSDGIDLGWHQSH